MIRHREQDIPLRRDGTELPGFPVIGTLAEHWPGEPLIRVV